MTNKHGGMVYYRMLFVGLSRLRHNYLKMNKILILAILFDLISCSREIIKYGGHQYKVIKAGNQTWMAENLSTQAYRNGKNISLITDYSLWPDLKIPGCGYYRNDTSMLKKYGMFYNWCAVEGGKLCPRFWRVPTYKDWNKLEEYLGGYIRAGGKMKAISGWKYKHISGDDIGFKALPGGYRLNDDYEEGLTSVWWSSSIFKNNDFAGDELGASYQSLAGNDIWIWGIRITYSSSELMSTLNKPNNGFYIRCVKNH
jgi:uncharacterized protein (TIGR02145 family)